MAQKRFKPSLLLWPLVFLLHRFTVVLVYILIAILHLIAIPLSLLLLRFQRVLMHWIAVKLIFFCFRTFFVRKSHRLSWRFDFHHTSYGLLSMVFPGRFTTFGKWMVFDELVGYDMLGVFQYRQDFVILPDEQNHYRIVCERGHDGTLDSDLSWIPKVGDPAQRERIFPSDNYFVRNYKAILKELFSCGCLPSPHLDAIAAKMDEIIERVVLPELLKIKADRHRHQLPLAIDLSLFAIRNETSTRPSAYRSQGDDIYASASRRSSSTPAIHLNIDPLHPATEPNGQPSVDANSMLDSGVSSLSTTTDTPAEAVAKVLAMA
eukprot:GILK01012306.1.p1 GENE.GILK01012306.1~~GILK01012306.1.p1  ORF type:complete len:331 (+),score=30.41 GILK01012306.1:36-995(+)